MGRSATPAAAADVLTAPISRLGSMARKRADFRTGTEITTAAGDFQQMTRGAYCPRKRAKVVAVPRPQPGWSASDIRDGPTRISLRSIRATRLPRVLPLLPAHCPQRSAPARRLPSCARPALLLRASFGCRSSRADGRWWVLRGQDLGVFRRPIGRRADCRPRTCRSFDQQQRRKRPFVPQ